MIEHMLPAASTRLDVNALVALCGQEATDLLLSCAVSDIPAHAQDDLTSKALSGTLPACVHQICLGPSTDGSEIYAYTWGEKGPRILLYAWPHPDEPAGALAARWLLEHAASPALSHARWMVIPCADPAAAKMSKQWARGSSMQDYVYGSLRLEHLGREIDYGFPIRGKTLSMPPHRDAGRACQSAGRCVQPQVCGETCMRTTSVAGPLPESLALARAIDDFMPDLAVGLHNAPAGGAYNFWLWDFAGLRSMPLNAL